MSLTQACIWDEELVGVVGMDVDMSDIMEGVTYFSLPAITEAFIIDPTGELIIQNPFNGFCVCSYSLWEIIFLLKYVGLSLSAMMVEIFLTH